MSMARVSSFGHASDQFREFSMRRIAELVGASFIAGSAGLILALMSWSARDPSFNHATDGRIRNFLGAPGAVIADLAMQLVGFAAVAAILPLALQGLHLITRHAIERPKLRLFLWLLGLGCAAGAASLLPVTDRWPLPTGLGGVLGDAMLALPRQLLGGSMPVMALFGLLYAIVAILALSGAAGLGFESEVDIREQSQARAQSAAPAYLVEEEDDDEPGAALTALGAVVHAGLAAKAFAARKITGLTRLRLPRSANELARPSFGERREPIFEEVVVDDPVFGGPRDILSRPEPAAPRAEPAGAPARTAAAAPRPEKQRAASPRVSGRGAAPWETPSLGMLAEPRKGAANVKISQDALDQNARILEGVLDDFSVRGEIINVRPGPVVTLYELEPAPGIKSSRVIGLADDIARSMSAISARVAVVPGRNAIGIELPNQRREMVYLSELMASPDFSQSKHKLAIALGKTIGGEPVIVDLARMPHLLVAGTTGSGKSVAINTMILSLLYRLKPEECRLIMVDPKMLELSVYDNIPHLLTPVVTDPKKAVVALKWAVREMEDRYKKMSKVGVRNIDGFNARVAEAQAKGEVITRTVQTGFDHETGEAVFEHEEMDLAQLPYIVVIVDEMADLMLVAGKDIEGAIQRLAQMARAAGIHLIMATQRPSVDVITGTIKANFPTRISFQVTSKIDSRTILGEQGAEQLLGQGDMLYMAGGGRISRVHGPFVSDGEVEKVVAHLKTQGAPQYLDAITSEDDEGGDEGEAAAPGSMDFEEGGDLYDRAVNIVLRDKKCSTSYIQRRLSVGYNKAASLVERMEKEGVVSAPNHSGKREVLVGGGIDRGAFDVEAAE